MDIVEKMRGFESDHEPDGWPAIQMKQISALCDEIERLQGEIDKANAQEPVGYTGSGSIDAVKVGVEGHLFGSIAPSHPIALYTRPIPAQQSPEPRGTNKYGLDVGYMADKMNLFLRNIDRHTPSEAARVLARLAMVADEKVLDEAEFNQQSTAVAVPVSKDKIREVFMRNGFTIKEGQHDLKDYVFNAAYELLSLSPRITEQDAREIITDWNSYISDDNFIPDFEWGAPDWKKRLRALLNKLSSDQHGK